MHDPWRFSRIRASTRYTPAVWEVRVGDKVIGYVMKMSRELFRAGKTPRATDSIHESRRDAALWLYRQREAVQDERGATPQTGKTSRG